MNSNTDRNPTPRLEGKVAVVSGAGTYGGSGVGNGAAAAILMAREGAKVVLVDAEKQWADATRAIIEEEEGGEAITATANVTDSEDCRKAIDAAVERFGGVHILHNNVGGGAGSGSVVEATEESWQASMSINLMSMINMSRYAIPHMASSGGGAIINVSSVTALRPKAGRSSAPYTVNKSAVVGLTRAMALDHAEENVRVNCIMPGAFMTDISKAWSPEMRAGLERTVPLRRGGAPSEIVGAALYFASDASRYATGSILKVDGGAVEGPTQRILSTVSSLKDLA